ncbi:IclR family transcriptional regulator [Luteimonas sp. XNQY3]|nr:IclR family transcriptional regulator [Luteimonas sp. XNQY3]MCD9007832.1 IclR family transcriptional regulator [Luteimonas sp. XNQY3]
MAGNQSLERGLAVLELLDRTEVDLGVRDIARELGLSPTIVQRLVHTLAANGFVAQASETRRYRLGYRSVVLGSTMRREDRLLSAVTRELTQLADQHHLNGYLGVLREGGALYLDSIQSSGPISVRVLPGSHINMHSTAIGKMLLSTLADDTARAVLGPEPLQTYTAATRTSVDAVLADLAAIRRQDFAIVNGENIDSLASAAALIRDAGGQPVAAISVAFLSTERGAISLERAVRLVREAAHRCSQSIGYSGPPPSVAAPEVNEETP